MLQGPPTPRAHSLEAVGRRQANSLEPETSRCSAGCGRTGVLCAVDYVRQLLLTQVRGGLPGARAARCPAHGAAHGPASLPQTLPPDFSLLDLVLEMRMQRPAAVQTEVRAPGARPSDPALLPASPS